MIINFLQRFWGRRGGEGSRSILSQKLLRRRLFLSLSLCQGDAVIVILGDHAEAGSCPALQHTWSKARATLLAHPLVPWVVKVRGSVGSRLMDYGRGDQTATAADGEPPGTAARVCSASPPSLQLHLPVAVDAWVKAARVLTVNLVSSFAH